MTLYRSNSQQNVMKKQIGILVLVLMLCCGEGFAQQRQRGLKQRPTVGIALGGGGAKGAAHIGALKYMHEIGIPIDYVTGTSMGAIIGGLVALGYTPEELQQIIGSMDWSVYMSDAISRSQMSVADRNRRSTYLFTIPFNTGNLNREMESWKSRDEQGSRGYSFVASLPSGFVGGTNLLNLFNNLSVGYQDSMSFDSLPIPFACVATNVQDGTAEVMRSGRFATAIRASMAIPGVFSPVAVGDKLLMDGGMVNNFPVDICKELGADIVIGVEVADELHDDINNLQSLPQLVNQLINIVVKNKKTENRKLCDVYMRPDITGYGTLSFSAEAIDTLVQRGYNEAKRHTAQLLALKAMLVGYGEVEQRLQRHPATSILHDTIVLGTVEACEMTDEEYRWLLRKGNLRLNEPLMGADVEHAVGLYMGTGDYAAIHYCVSPTGDSLMVDSILYPVCRLKMDMQRAEPHAMSLGMRYDSQESASLQMSLGYNQNRLAGWKSLLTARLGYNTMLSTKVSWAGRSLATVNIEYRYRRGRFDMARPDNTRALMRHYTHLFELSLSEFHLRNFSITAGADDEYAFYTQPPTSDSSFYGKGTQQLRNNSVGAFLRAVYDNMDNAYFATQGMKADIDVEWRANTSDKRHSGYGGCAWGYRSYITPQGSRLTVIPQCYGRLLLGTDYHFAYRNLVAGALAERYVMHQLPFVGTNAPRQVEDMAAVLRCDVRYRVMEKHYLTLMVNYMYDSPTLAQLFDTSVCHEWWGVGCRYAVSTPIGPVSLDAHWSTLSRRVGLFFSLGYLF